MITVEQLLYAALEKGASDVHLTVGTEPHMRVNGVLKKMDYPQLDSEDVEKMILGLMNDAQLKQYRENRQIAFAVSIPMTGRFRINAFRQQGQEACAIRLIGEADEAAQKFNIPPEVLALAETKSGLILVNGPSASGRTTTLAALVDCINRERSVHIITLEKPVEYLHKHVRAVINQRGIGTDAFSYAEALYQAVRQDADVIVLGEICDKETAQQAMSAAESGHLVLASVTVPPMCGKKDAEEIVLGMFLPQEEKRAAGQFKRAVKAVVTQWFTQDENGRKVEYLVEK